MESDNQQKLADVRRAIDAIDQKIIDLLAQRQIQVEAAGRLKPKNNTQAVAAPDRVRQVIENRRQQAEAMGLSPDVAEAVWQAMINAFIKLEHDVNRKSGEAV